MIEVYLTVKEGPLQGKRYRFELTGSVTLGRSPGEGGISLPDDPTVGRTHGEIYAQRGRLMFRNLSSNGSIINDRIVQGEQELAPGDVLRLGTSHLIEVRFKAPVGAGSKGGESVMSSGPLASPVVRAIVGIYLLGMVGLAFYFGTTDKAVGREWQAARQQYESQYQPEGLSAEEKEARLSRADQLVLELEAYVRTRRASDARSACREIMALDSHQDSPVYRFGAKQLGRLGG